MRNLLSLTLAALCLVLAASVPCAAKDGPDPAPVIRGLLISNAFGKAFSGEPVTYTDARVDFSRKVRPSNFLVPNKAVMVQGAVFKDTGKRLTGSIQYADPHGRTAAYLYELSYSTKGEHHYRVTRTGVKTYEPVRPRFEGYFIPTDAISLKKMRAMDTGKLLEFAREHGETPREGVRTEAKRYHVVAFCMHRLRDKPTWAVMHGDKRGTSWSRGDWHVAAITAEFGFNGTDDELFRVLYAPGRRSPCKGQLVQLGGMTNRYMTPQLGPAKSATVPAKTRQMLDAYEAKLQPKVR